jgi:hypothetical protein
LKKSKTIKQKDMKVKEHITYKGPREQSRWLRSKIYHLRTQKSCIYILIIWTFVSAVSRAVWFTGRGQRLWTEQRLLFDAVAITLLISPPLNPLCVSPAVLTCNLIAFWNTSVALDKMASTDPRARGDESNSLIRRKLITLITRMWPGRLA